MAQNTSSAVMQQRRDPPDALDYFPTPPWATRALFKHVLAGVFSPNIDSLWDPACGGGHMSFVFGQMTTAPVYSSDVFDYGWGHAVGSFVGVGADRAECPFRPSWIVTNPPFAMAEEFAIRAIEEAECGVALLVRSAWMEGVGRYERIFSKVPPTILAPFVERVPMLKGRWDPNASSATAYCWFVWSKPATGETRVKWIPPGCRRSLHREADMEMADRGESSSS